MVSVVFTPRWFYGIDGIFEAVAVIVALLIAFYSYKLYSHTKEKRHVFFSLSFLGIAVGFIAKIVTNLSLVSSVVGSVKHVGFFFYGHHTLALEHILYVAGFLGYRLLLLFGLLGIYFVIHKFRAKKLILFSAYMVLVLTLITTFSTWAYPIFYLTAALLLLFISQFYYDSWLGKRGQKKNKNAKALLNAFGVLMAAQLSFTLVILNLYFYVLAEVLQLAGFLMLLYVYYKLVVRKK
jgi:hypothetical protein|tara:strand:+ start:154 stop:864 length:711 start_codon:yes stop_codon:yes gene_type:complete